MAENTRPAAASQSPTEGLLRRLLPVALVVAGAGGLLYGFAFHAVSVLPKPQAEDTAEEAPSDVPPEVLPDEEPVFSPDVLFGDAPAEVAPLGEVPAGAQAHDEPPPGPYTFSESRVVQEVTIGGLERLASGEIVRTYGPDEKAPTYCPT